MSKPRSVAIDMARGVTIILVAAFHANLTSSFNGMLADLRMPLFFLVTGFLFSSRYINNPKILFRKRVVTLLLPYFSAALLFYFFWVVRTIIDKDEASLARAFIGIFYGNSPDDWLIVNVTLWFLLCLFCTQIVFCIVMRYVQNINSYLQCIVFVVISLIGVWLGKMIYLPWSLDVAMSCQIFLFVGYKLKKHELLDKIKPFSLITFALMAIFAITAYYNPPVYVGSRIYNHVILFYIAGICGSIVVIKLISLLSSIRPIAETLSYIGRESLIILIFHSGLFIYATGVIDNRIGINVHWSVSWLISIAGSLVLAEIIKRIPVLNFLLNGKPLGKSILSEKKAMNV